MRLELHHRHCLLFMFDEGLSAAAAHRRLMLVYPQLSVSNRAVSEWFARFERGDRDVSDKQRSGRQSTINDQALLQLVKSDPRQTTAVLAERHGSKQSTVALHLRNLGFIRKLEKWIPHELSEENMIQRATICASLLSRHASEPLFDRILTADEKWVQYHNRRRGHVWSLPGEPVPKCPKVEPHPKQVLLCIWWAHFGVVHYEILKQGQTINASLYSTQLQRVHEKLLAIRPSMVTRRGVLYLHDNAKPHTAKLTQEKLKQLGWEVLPHPPYSPDIAPCDYYLFRSLDNYLVNKSFSDEEVLKTALATFFTSQKETFWRRGIHSLQERWQHVVDAEGQYFND